MFSSHSCYTLWHWAFQNSICKDVLKSLMYCCTLFEAACRGFLLYRNSIFSALLDLVLLNHILRWKLTYSENLTRCCKMQTDKNVCFQIFIFTLATPVKFKKMLQLMFPWCGISLKGKRLFSSCKYVHLVSCEEKKYCKAVKHQLCNKEVKFFQGTGVSRLYCILFSIQTSLNKPALHFTCDLPVCVSSWGQILVLPYWHCVNS